MRCSRAEATCSASLVEEPGRAKWPVTREMPVGGGGDVAVVPGQVRGRESARGC